MALDYELQSRKLLILFTSVRRWYLSKAMMSVWGHQFPKITAVNYFLNLDSYVDAGVGMISRKINDHPFAKNLAAIRENQRSVIVT